MPSLLDALIQKESSGRRGILGPKTKWGHAAGLTQVLPGTAAEMAQKLGIQYRPDLMTATSDEGAAYQRQIGQAYLQEGLQKTGNVRDALRYYHGGPNRAQWGPKTEAYANDVLALAGNNQQMMPQQQFPPVMNGGMSQMPRPQDMLNDEPIGVTSQGSLAGMMQTDPASLAQNTPQVKPRAFDKGGKGWVIAGIIADAIAGGFGGKGGFAPAYAATQENNRQEQLYREKVAAERAERMRPQIREVGGSLGMVDPNTGSFTPTYQPPAQPPQIAQDAEWFNSQPEAVQRQILRFMDITRPIVESDQSGRFLTQRGVGVMDQRTPVRTGTDPNGRRVVQYSDGSIDYAD